MNETIREAIEDIEEQEKELQKQKELLKSLSLDEKLSEEKWHEICETQMRYSPLMGDFVKNIFPNAEDILVHSNYVYFTLHGIKVQIPTSRAMGINIDTSWYTPKGKEPELYRPPEEKRMYEYFRLCDEKASWDKKAKKLIHGNYRKWVLFFLWFFKYKWHQPNRGEWEDTFQETEDKHDFQVQRFNENRKHIVEQVHILFEQVLPETETFSKTHYSYNGRNMFSSFSIDRIRELESETLQESKNKSEEKEVKSA